MAYNFEATFTRPILARLDAGTLGNSEDWARAVTSAYVSTIKAGLPLGVPPILPAPGLNPLAPPPFAIGVSPFTTADTRSNRMYKVLRAYFFTKDVQLDKAAIKSLGTTIALLVKKTRERTKQVKSTIEQIKILQENLKELPKLVKQIIQDIKDEIKQQIIDIKDAFNSLDGFRLTMSPSDFLSLFRQELDLIELLKNFDPTSLRSATQLSIMIFQYEQAIKNYAGNFSNAMSTKRYFYSRISGAVKIIVQLAQGVADPSKIINVINDLATKKKRVIDFLNRLNQFDFFIRYVKPKLKKLELKVKRIIADIRNRIKLKVQALREKLKKKVDEFIKKKKEGKRSNIYSKSTKNKNDRKKKFQASIKKFRKRLKKILKILKLSVGIAGKATTLVSSVEKNSKLMVVEIKNYLKKLEESRVGFQELFSGDVKASDLYQPVQITQPTIGVSAITLETLEQNKLSTEIDKATKYMTGLGLGKFGNLAVMVISQAKCDFETFKRFFEGSTRIIQQQLYELIALIEDVEKLATEIKNFNEDKKKSTVVDNKVPKKTLLDRIKSFKDILQYIATQVIPTVQKYPMWAKTQYKKEKSKLEVKIKKFRNDLKVYALNALPIKSDVQDPKDKAAIAAAKEKKIKDKAAQVKRVLRLTSYVAKMARGGVTIYKNIEKGDYSLATNQLPIDNIVDGYYSFRMDDQSPGVREVLSKEKISVKDGLKGIAIIDMLVRALIQVLKDPNSSDIITQLNSDIEDLKNNPPAIQTLTTIKNLFNSPPSNPKEAIEALNLLTLNALQDYSVINRIVNIERKYLRKTKELLRTILDIKQLKGTKAEKRVKVLHDKLNKNDSFILLLVDLIKAEIKKFKSFVKKKVQSVVKKIQAKLKEKRSKKEEETKKDLLTLKNKKVNSDAIFMSFIFGLAARAFWIGAGWIGPTGSQHRTFTIGSFRPRIKATPEGGASSVVRQLAKAYEFQLYGMKGVVTPPAITGIPPLPFNGYK